MDKHIKKILTISNYKLNEGVRITEVDENPNNNDDAFNRFSEDQNSVNKPEENDDQVEDNDANNDSIVQPDVETPPIIDAEQEPEESVNDIQTDIIKLNIESISKITSNIDQIKNALEGIDMKIKTLSSDVDDVKEPTSEEKMMKMKSVSFPYINNLNDYWKTESNNDLSLNNKDEYGIKELEDGSFIANFDDLPKYNDLDVNSSFDEFV